METLGQIMKAIPLSSLALLFAVCGIALLLVLLSGVIRASRKNLKRYRSTGESVADLLNYSSLIEDGIILCKNGALLAGWIYQAQDAASATNIDREVWARRLNEALRPLGSGWMLHVDAVRQACPSYSARGLSHFPDAVSRALDEERREYFERGGELFEGYNVLTVTWFAPRLAEQKFIDLMFDDSGIDGAAIAESTRTGRLLADFKRELGNIESRLSSVFRLKRLRAYRVEGEHGVEVYDDLLRWLHFALTGENHPMRLPGAPAFIDCLLGGQEMLGGVLPRIGERYIQTLSFTNFPMESQPGMLNALAQLPCEYRWSSRFICLDQHEALARLEKARRKWKQQERGIIDVLLNNPGGRVNADAVDMRADAEEMIRETQSGLTATGFYTMTVVLLDREPQRLTEAANYLKKVCGELGFPAQVESVNNLEAFLGSLPGHGVENIRAPIINTMNFADLIPSSSIWTGEEHCPCDFYPPLSPALLHAVTSGYSPFRLNLHVRDLGHTIIFGPTGAGKSVLLATLAAQLLRYKGMTVFAFDKGMSMFTLCKAVGGQHYDIGGSEIVFDGETGSEVRRAAQSFCPLQYLGEQKDIAWAGEWLATCCELNGLTVTARHREAIATALLMLAGSSPEYRSLGNISNQIQDPEVRQHLQPYAAEDGLYHYLLGAERDGLALPAGGGLCVFEIEELMNMGDARLLLPVLLYLFRRIERNLTGQPAAIILDEAWLMLGNEVFRGKIREWFKVLRKANCSVILATQSLSDAVGSGILDVIKESTATKIFLPNPYARGEDAREVYARMGLNSRQIALLSEAVPKRQYYYSSEHGHRLFELALGELQLALLAVSDRDSVTQVRRLIAQHGEDGWLYHWLRERRVSEGVIEGIRNERGRR